MGADTLFNSDVLKQGKEDLKDLVIVTPWFPQESNEQKAFADKACKRWGEGISWRTAASYDATQAFITAISQSKNPTRENVLTQLKSINLPASKTSGSELKFTNGQRNQEPVLVRVVKDSKESAVKGNNKKCTGLKTDGFYFERVE
jgi:ABC-type branched-subunit amino acid transport system substrate-binding protein